ncbi:MAG: MSC_0882 family membrane protein [Metamycoplasmataceae bacterium]
MNDIKPIYNSGTISFVQNPDTVLAKKIASNFIKDSEGLIPNGIYKVFKLEQNKQIFCFILYFILFASQIIFISLLATILSNYSWLFYVLTGIAAIIFGLLFIFNMIDYLSLKKSITAYRASIRIGSKITPPFISNLYLKLNLKQVTSNWITIAALFYGSISLIIFWWLKDVNWWIFEFDVWIRNLGPKPELIAYIVLGILGGILSFYIFITIFRKKRIIDIQAFFGNEVISQLEINKMVQERNKAYRRIFIISILVILVFPIIVKLVLKYTKKGAI